jgi:hypothetical protein
VLALDELLPGCGSVFDPLTVAVFLMVLPAIHALPSCTVRLIVAPFSEDNENGNSVPTVQLTGLELVHGIVVVEQVNLWLTMEQLTFFADTLTKLVLAGSKSATLTSTAFAGPKSTTPMA